MSTEDVRWFVMDVAPYASVFVILATVIVWQLKLIAAMLDIESRIDEIEEKEKRHKQ